MKIELERENKRSMQLRKSKIENWTNSKCWKASKKWEHRCKIVCFFFPDQNFLTVRYKLEDVDILGTKLTKPLVSALKKFHKTSCIWNIPFFWWETFDIIINAMLESQQPLLHQRKSHFTCHQLCSMDVQFRRSQHVSNLEGRVKGTVGGGFIWKSDHDLKHAL